MRSNAVLLSPENFRKYLKELIENSFPSEAKLGVNQ